MLRILNLSTLNLSTLNFSATSVSYGATGYFSKIVLDYIGGAAALKAFYAHEPSVKGIEQAIAARNTDAAGRNLLVDELTKQYQSIETDAAVKSNIERLGDENTFTICTAHQPNIFTGHLYFIYKILHAIKLSAHLNTVLPQYHFVPVYYMGSEDADLEELGEVTVDGTTYHWQTNQKGAVGRMLVDDALLKMIQAIAGQLLVQPHGEGIIELIKKCYAKGTTIQQATFMLVNALFAAYGLVILLPDNAALKKTMQPVFADELLNGTSAAVVTAASAELEKHYKVQAQPREINLFYLLDDIRERIERHDDRYQVLNTEISFSKAEMLAELEQYPERFSPNVILRGLYQETILPNVAFIGGGGELAYWLQFKTLFEQYNIPYPVLVLRNSFVIMEENAAAKMEQIQLNDADLFKPANDLLTALVQRESTAQLQLSHEKELLVAYYQQLKTSAGSIDTTLQKHVDAIGTKALHKVEALEKKMLRAEKRKYEAEKRHIQFIKDTIFPGGNLQERVENFMPFYARHGQGFIQLLCQHSFDIQSFMCILKKN
jgi:bacillithiol synthase